MTLKPGGGFQARLEAIRGAPLVADADLLEALPDSLRNGLQSLHLRRAADGGDRPRGGRAGREPGGPVVVWWDGAADLHDAALRLGVDVTGVEGRRPAAACTTAGGWSRWSATCCCRQAEVFGQPLQNLHAPRRGGPGVAGDAAFPRPQGRPLRRHGRRRGPRRVRGAEPRYDVTLKAIGIDLAEFARHNNFGPDAQMKGLASAGVHLSGEGGDVSGLKGNGRIDVPEGKLYRLPLQLDLLKAFGLRLPDRTAFEQAHAVFAIDGPQLQVQSLDLYGNAVSLRGQGTVDLVGSDLNLDFNADWGRLAQVLPAGRQRDAAGDQRPAARDQDARPDRRRAFREGAGARRGRFDRSGRWDRRRRVGSGGCRAATLGSGRPHGCSRTARRHATRRPPSIQDRRHACR